MYSKYTEKESEKENHKPKVDPIAPKRANQDLIAILIPGKVVF